MFSDYRFGMRLKGRLCECYSRFLKAAARVAEHLFDEAASFASTIGPKRLVNISHSEGREGWHSNGVVTVWYWKTEPEAG